MEKEKNFRNSAKESIAKVGINWDSGDEDYFQKILKDNGLYNLDKVCGESSFHLPRPTSGYSLAYYYKKLDDISLVSTPSHLQEVMDQTAAKCEKYDSAGGSLASPVSLSSESSPAGYSSVQDIVSDGLLGLTMLIPNVSVIPSKRIIMRSDHSTMIGKVKLLSGGRAGQDPLYAGFVGYGLLTAAVYGDSMGGPTPKQILAALRELNTPYGIIMIIKNEIGERLNFGLAMERAREEGILVDMVMVADDCWESQRTKTGRRCLSGILAMIKVAGAMSEAKKSMRDIYIMCRAMILTSLSITIPESSFVRFGTDMNGIGGRSMEKMNIKNLVKEAVYYMIDAKKYLSASIFPINKFIVLLNSYFVDGLLLGTIAKELVYHLRNVDICLERMYCNTFISGPIPGFSITLVKDIEEELLWWFDAAVPSRVWPDNFLYRISEAPPFRVQEVSYSPDVECKPFIVNGPRNPPEFEYYSPECLSVACSALISSELMLNKMDPEGQYGTLIANGAKAVIQALKKNKLDFKFPYRLLRHIGLILEESITGTTGAMLALIFTGIAQSLLSYSSDVYACFDMWTQAIKKGINTLSSMARMRVGECTLIDALYPFYNGLMEVPTKSGIARFKDGVEAAEAGSQQTCFIKSPRHINNWPEPGAQAVAIVLRSILETLKRLISEDIKLGERLEKISCPIESRKTIPLTEEYIEICEEDEEEQILEEFEGEEVTISHENMIIQEMITAINGEEPEPSAGIQEETIEEEEEIIPLQIDENEGTEYGGEISE